MTFDISQLSDRFDQVAKSTEAEIQATPTIKALKEIIGDRFSKDPAFIIQNAEDASPLVTKDAKDGIVITAKKTNEHIFVWDKYDGNFSVQEPDSRDFSVMTLARVVDTLAKFYGAHKSPEAAPQRHIPRA